MEESSHKQLKNLSSKAEALYSLYPFESWHHRTKEELSSARQENHQVVVSCSGGADSIFSLLLIHHYLNGSQHCVHVNHGVRGKNSDKDASFVKEFCDKINCESSILSLQVPEDSNEGFLRDKRMQIIGIELERMGAKYLVQGHQKDDIAESFLWRLSRGASPSGLCSPKPVQKHGDTIFLRPFLTASRAEIRNCLKELAIPWREDETNHSARYLRNRIRAQVLPQWKACMDRELLKGVESSRDLIEEQNDAMQVWILDSYNHCIKGKDLSIEELQKEPIAVQRGVLSEWLSISKIEFTHQNLSEIIKLIPAKEKMKFNLGDNTWVEQDSNLLKLLIPVKDAKAFPANSFTYDSVLFLPDQSSITVRKDFTQTDFENFKKQKKVDPRFEAWICSGKIKSSFFVARSKKENDRYQKLGSKGSKKVAKLIIDQKIPSYARNSLPLILNQLGEILWIPGFPPSEKYKVDHHSTKVIRLTYSPSPT
jgi:tRNA(Ile)-lysidine synthase